MPPAVCIITWPQHHQLGEGATRSGLRASRRHSGPRPTSTHMASAYAATDSGGDSPGKIPPPPAPPAPTAPPAPPARHSRGGSAVAGRRSIKQINEFSEGQNWVLRSVAAKLGSCAGHSRGNSPSKLGCLSDGHTKCKQNGAWLLEQPPKLVLGGGDFFLRRQAQQVPALVQALAGEARVPVVVLSGSSLNLENPPPPAPPAATDRQMAAGRSAAAVAQKGSSSWRASRGSRKLMRRCWGLWISSRPGTCKGRRQCNGGRPLNSLSRGFQAKLAPAPKHMQAAGPLLLTSPPTLLLTPAALISCRKQCRARRMQMR